MLKRTGSYKTVINRRKSIGESHDNFISNTKLEQKSAIKKVQLEIKLNISVKLIDALPKLPCSQSISFRLKPSSKPSASPPTIPPVPSSVPTGESAPRPPPPFSLTAPTRASVSPPAPSTLVDKLNQFKPKLHVDLAYCHLTDQDIPIITEQVIREKKCTELWLYGNHMTSKGIEILAPSLEHNMTLTSLDLSFNQISDHGVEILTKSLSGEKNSCLKILHLSKNMITDNGMKSICSMLETNQTLIELWLSNNEITNEGIKRLSNILAYKNKTLKVLSLSMNLFLTDDCINNLMEIFQHNQTLKKFWMQDCNLTEQGKFKLQQITKQKKNFQLVL